MDAGLWMPGKIICGVVDRKRLETAVMEDYGEMDQWWVDKRKVIGDL